MRRLATIFLAATVEFSLVVTDPAGAQTCYTLQAELTHLQSRGGGSSADRARYERAFREQARVLARTEARARTPMPAAASCSFAGDRTRPAASWCRRSAPCRRISPGSTASGDPAATVVRGASGNCRARSASEAADGAAWNVGELSRPPGGPSSPKRRCRPAALSGRSASALATAIISRSASPPRRIAFGDDAQTCSSMCPGTESKLYFMPIQAEARRRCSRWTAAPIRRFPTAFQYRKSINPSCSCRRGRYS